MTCSYCAGVYPGPHLCQCDDSIPDPESDEINAAIAWALAEHLDGVDLDPELYRDLARRVGLSEVLRLIQAGTVMRHVSRCGLCGQRHDALCVELASDGIPF